MEISALLLAVAIIWNEKRKKKTEQMCMKKCFGEQGQHELSIQLLFILPVSRGRLSLIGHCHPRQK